MNRKKLTFISWILMSSILGINMVLVDSTLVTIFVYITGIAWSFFFGMEFNEEQVRLDMVRIEESESLCEEYIPPKDDVKD